MNKAVEFLRVFSDRQEPDKIYQTDITTHMNDDLVKIDKQSVYEHPHDLLISDMEQFTGAILLVARQ